MKNPLTADVRRLVLVLYGTSQLCVAAAWVLEPRLLAARAVPWGGAVLLAAAAALALGRSRWVRWGIVAVAAYMAAYSALALLAGADVATDVPGAYGRKLLWLVGVELLQLYGWMASDPLPRVRR